MKEATAQVEPSVATVEAAIAQAAPSAAVAAAAPAQVEPHAVVEAAQKVMKDRGDDEDIMPPVLFNFLSQRYSLSSAAFFLYSGLNSRFILIGISYV
jgi:hypothetical protein